VSGRQQIEVDRVICGDCLEVLRSFPDNSVDAVVTDPPYGLNEIKDLPGLLRAWLEGEDGSEWQTKGFMGKGWDKVPPPSVWREVLRVMKPGAYILCFAGCRTVDLMGISLRLAGFEDNNLLAWLQGQGFPKATDVGKMIDRAAGAERKVVGYRESLGYPDGATAVERNRKGTKGHAVGMEVAPGGVPITAPATPEAKKWDGWKYGKQALKPAMEPILLMQKPFERGLAGYQNVLKWGTGALNIEACRIPVMEGVRPLRKKYAAHPANPAASSYDMGSGYAAGITTRGRFPANVLLDEAAAQALDKQSGERRAAPCGPNAGLGFWRSGNMYRSSEQRGYLDSEGASRFFYVAKASTRERNAGLDERNLHPTVKPLELMRYLVRLITPPNGVVLDPFCGTGTTCIAAMLEGFHYIGVDFEPKYCEWARKRIAWYKAHPRKTRRRPVQAKIVEISLFEEGVETEEVKCW